MSTLPPHHDTTVPPDAGVPLAALFRAVWQARRFLAVALSVAVVLVAGVIGVSWMRAPYERLAQVEFRLTFPGADKNEYPNGTPFSRADVVSTAALTEVYRNNELERYLEFDRFRDAVFVLESNPALELLRFQYEARLSDTKLPAVERSRIEAEFNQKRESLKDPQMSLRFMLPSSVGDMPAPLMQKVLNDILSAWAKQVATQRGALRYQLDLLTPNVILKDTLNTQTMLIRYDLLRRHVARAIRQLDDIAALPGATVVRVSADNFSLTDLRTNLVDLLEFQLNPLIRRRLIYALPPGEAALNVLYLEDRVLELERSRDTSLTRKGQLETALRTFASETTAGGATSTGDNAAVGGGNAGTPQFNDTFLDRLIDIAGQSGAMGYRQELTDRVIAAGEEALEVAEDIAFYRETLRLLRDAVRGKHPEALKPEDVLATFQQIQDKVVGTLTLTGEAYDLISSNHLNPRRGLFSVVGPYSYATVSHVSARTMVVVGVITVLSVFALLVAGVMLMHLIRTGWFRHGGGTSPVM